MRRKRLLSWVLTFAMIAGMFVVPARADNTTTITQDSPSGQMTITLEIPKKTPAASDLTYTAPAGLAYSGSEKTATVAAASGVTGMGDITVKYYSDAARTTEAAPKNVGTYYVGATVAEGDQYAASTAVLFGDGWTFTITASTPSSPAAPTKASATKNSITLNAVSGCEYSKDGTNWQNGTEFTGLLPSTEYTFYQRVKATANTNASAASSATISTTADTYAMTITLTIKAKDPATVTKAPTAKTGLTFNGGDQALVNAGTASGGTMQYALGANATTAPSTGWDTVIPTGKAVGTYYVWYRVVGDADHTDVAAACITVGIGQTSLTAQGVTIYAIPDQNSTGSQLTPKPVVKHLGYLLKEDVDYTLSYGTNSEIGTEKGTVTITGKGGYNGTLEKKFNIILPAYSGTLTVTAPARTPTARRSAQPRT
ncbi:MAG: hypothetical protein IJQ45_09215 [Clostridia bacterium]|nr:hypothetical protein [Clostridia bacterium]